MFNEGTTAYFGMNWFDAVDWLVSNVMLPLGGLGVAIFLTWRVSAAARRAGFQDGSPFKRAYMVWLMLLRWLAPICVILVFLNSVGLFEKAMPADVEADEAQTELENPSDVADYTNELEIE